MPPTPRDHAPAARTTISASSRPRAVSTPRAWPPAIATSATGQCSWMSTPAPRQAAISARGRDDAEIVVLAAGAWSRGVGGIPARYQPPVRPIKGQMLALQMDPKAPILRHVVWLPRGYLVPRNDGRLIVGGTVEERGFDTTITAGGMLALLEGAWRAVPTIEELPIA